MLKFISTLFYIVFVTILVGVGGLLIGTMLPIPGNIEMKIVKSGSMEPNIPTGSVVMVKPATTYAFNDVITFGKDTKTDVPTTHRIVGVEGTGANATYMTKGDANEEADPQSVMQHEIIGKVVFSLPYVGFVLDFARQPMGFVLLIAIPAGLVILEEILTIFREATKGRRRRKDDDNETSASGGGGGELSVHNTLDLRGAPRIVYSRMRLMDEILVPMLEEMNESFKRRMAARNAPASYQGDASLARRRLDSWLQADAYGISTSLTVGLVFMSTIFAGANGGTLAYFQDIERSMGNMFGAGMRWEEEAIAALEEMRLAESELFALTALPEGEVLGEADGTPEEKLAEEPVDEPVEEPTEAPEPQEGAEEPAPQIDRSEAIPAPETPEEPAEAEEGESAHTQVNEPIPDPQNEPIPDPAPETPEPTIDAPTE